MKTVILSGDKATFNLREILSYRDLLRNLALRDITVRYKQTWLGVIWALIRPTFNIVVFGAIAMLINKSDDARSSFLFVGTGVLIWTLMVSCITDSSNSIVSNRNLLTKVYFPKMVLPLTSVIVCLIDFSVSLVIFLIVFIALHGFPGVQIFLLPVFVFIAVIFCFGLGLFFSALNAKYRDVNYALPFILQFAYYASPVFLSTAFYLQYLPVTLQKIFLVNPLVFIIDGFRYCFYGEWQYFSLLNSALSILVIGIITFAGVKYFLRFERGFADYI